MRVDCERCIEAVLTHPQLRRLCERFSIDPGDLTVNLDGLEKYVVLSGTEAFLFPRDPKRARSLKRELAVYETFSGLKSGILPKLLGRVYDPEISFYELGVVTRMPGIALSEIAADIDFEQLQGILLNLASAIAEWHSVPAASLSSSITRVQRLPSRGKIKWKNWHRRVLSPDTVGEAARFVQRLIIRHAEEKDLDYEGIAGTETAAKWERTLMQLASLRRALIHADLHEDHILLQPERDLAITGILDWGSTRIDNPIWDFSFSGLGPSVWKWADRFITLRKIMWCEYLRVRNIRGPSLHSLHLFFTLMEIISLARPLHDTVSDPARTGLISSLDVYLERLEQVTRLL